MVTDLGNLVRLTRSQVKPAARMLARVFYDDPVYLYFMPDSSQRVAKLPHHFAIRLRHCISSGEAYATSANMEGIAMWFPPDYSKLTLGKILRWGTFAILSGVLTSSGRESISRQMAVNEYFNSLHIRIAPFCHWYLSSIGVRPEYQGKGYANTLLKPMLARLDKEQLPCYLDTQKEDNIPLYEHYGFRLIDESVIPGTTIRNWAMLREGSDYQRAR